MNQSKNLLLALLFSGAFLFLASPAARAGSATWQVNPTNDWNTATNWSPRTVPNSPADTATFLNSNTPSPVVHSSVELNSIVFTDSLTSFTITAGEAGSGTTASLTLSGTGVVNNSEASIQAMQAAPTSATNGSTNVIALRNSAAVAGQAFTFLTALGGGNTGLVGGEIQFFDNSTLSDAAVEADKGQEGGGSGRVSFFGNSSAGDGQVVNISGSGATASGVTMFHDAATAGTSAVTSYAASAAGVGGGMTYFLGSSTADESFLFAVGSFVAGAGAGTVVFSDTSSAGNAFLDGDAGTNGGTNGTFRFLADSTGGTAQLDGSVDLEIADHNPPGITIGSLGGFGSVSLGSNELTVGSNNLSTTLYGVIQGSGSVRKIGTGVLTLIGSSTYAGGTRVTAGGLNVSNTTGSGSGTGAVRILSGILSGSGTIAGRVTLGTGHSSGAILAPSSGSKPLDTLTIQSALTFNADGVFICRLHTRKVLADQVIAAGVTIGPGAKFTLKVVANQALPTDQSFVVISNTAGTPISGNFANLPDGAVLNVGPNNLQASYTGGDGNDLTLTVVP